MNKLIMGDLLLQFLDVLIENTVQDFISGITNIFIDLLITFIGAFLGFLSALYLYNRGVNKENKAANSRQKYLYNENLRYLSILLESIINTVSQQSKHYNEFQREYKNNPLGNHLPTLIINNDFERLKSLDSSTLRDAYLVKFSSTKGKLENYHNLFSFVDFIDRICKEKELENKSHIRFKHKDALYIKEIVDEVYIRIAMYVSKLSNSFPTNYKNRRDYQFLLNYREVYEKLSKNAMDISDMRDWFVLPLFENILIEVDKEDFANEILIFLKKVINRIRNIEFNALEFSNGIGEFEIETKEAVDFLINQHNLLKEEHS